MDCVASGKRLPGVILSGFDAIKKYISRTMYRIIV